MIVLNLNSDGFPNGHETTSPGERNLCVVNIYTQNLFGNKYTKHNRKTGCLCHNRKSPDGIFDEQTLLEIKCPVPSSSWSTLHQLFESGKYDVGKDENGDLVVKEKGIRGIYLQLQLTMYCTGLKQCKLLVWMGVDEHKYIDILYNETYVNNQVTRLKNFYVKKLLPCLVNEIQDDRLMT
ncbi:unnamed protein product [Mytilus coruscus]|uniref:YqaJ viral recombinase domain-containing protein n=1 Tax=Mytilus coruscus TaxID=42192 RepID=A0A6J8CSF9_MYTCO|nr:unnamed protein product [Mytilus coruscus]